MPERDDRHGEDRGNDRKRIEDRFAAGRGKHGGDADRRGHDRYGTVPVGSDEHEEQKADRDHGPCGDAFGRREVGGAERIRHG